MDGKKLLLPAAIGAGALYLLTRGQGGAGTIAGTVPAGRPFVRLVFKAHDNPLDSETDIASTAAAAVAAVANPDGSPWFTVTGSAPAATAGPGTIGYAFTTVVARVAGFLEGRTWEEVLAPLKGQFGGLWQGKNITLVDVAQVADGSISLGRQEELAAGTPGILDVGDIFKGLNSTVQLALVATAVVGGYLLYKEFKAARTL